MFSPEANVLLVRVSIPPTVVRPTSPRSGAAHGGVGQTLAFGSDGDGGEGRGDGEGDGDGSGVIRGGGGDGDGGGGPVQESLLQT